MPDHGMYADVPNHPQCFAQLHTGSFQFVRPSIGAWTLYGLGTENENLPGFVTINPLPCWWGSKLWQCLSPCHLPRLRIGSLGQSLNDALIPHLKNNRLNPHQQRKQLDFIQSMNRDFKEGKQDGSQIEGVRKL